MSPPKKERAPAKSALQNFELLVAYHVTALLAKVFEKPFWFFEQRRGQLMDRLANKGVQ